MHKCPHESATPNFQWPMAGTNYPVILVLSREPRFNQLHLQAWHRDKELGFFEPWGTATTIPRDRCGTYLCAAKDEGYIRDYSECTGVLQALIDQGYVVDLDQRVRPGDSFVDFPRVRFTDKAKALAPELFTEAAR